MGLGFLTLEDSIDGVLLSGLRCLVVLCCHPLLRCHSTLRWYFFVCQRLSEARGPEDSFFSVKEKFLLPKTFTLQICLISYIAAEVANLWIAALGSSRLS